MATRLAALRPGIDDDLRVELGSLRANLFNAVSRGDNVLLVGRAGSGKTTALLQLAADLQDAGRPVVLVRGQLAATLDDLIALIWDALPSERPAGPISMMPMPAISTDAILKARGPQAQIVSTAKKIEELRRSEPVTILMDDLLEAEIAEGLFSRARDLLWDLGHQWVVAARPAQEAVLMQPPAAAFWDTRIQVPDPTPAELTAALQRRGLLLERSGPASTSLREILAAAANPDGPPPAAPPAATAALSEPERRLLDTIAALRRPVTVDDPELLAFLGWSRAYASAVVRRLADADLVQVAPEQRSGPGRPRNLYSAPSSTSSN